MITVDGHLYERIVQSVLDEVRSGRLQPGDRVASEHELAAQFTVSRITSRRALEELSRLQVVERIQGRGTFVTRAAAPLERIHALPVSIAETAPPARTNHVALVLPDFSDSFGLHLVYAVEEACARAGAHLILKRTYGDREREESAIASLVADGVGGLIVFPVHGEHYNPALLKTVLAGFPTVLVDRYLRGIPASAVVIDNRAACQALTEHLIGLGHERIAFVSPPVLNTSTLEERLDGFRAALARHGLGFRNEQHLQNLRSTLPRQFQAENINADQHTLKRFIADHSGSKSPITAFVCSEYNLALEVLQLLEAMRYSVPKDYSIVCFDSPEVPLEPPRFTHLRQDEAAMGRTAVELVLAKLRGEDTPMLTQLEFRLVEGRSTAARPNLARKTPQPATRGGRTR